MRVESLLEAVYAHLQTTVVPSFVEGIYTTRAPLDTVGDYITISFVSATAGRTMTSKWEDVTLRFSVWSDDTSPSEAIRIAELLADELDDLDAALSVSVASVVWVTRENSVLVEDPDGGYQYVLEYSIRVEEA